LNSKDLILRLKDGMDTAEPSTNGLTAQNLTYLSSALGDSSYSAYAKRTSQAFSSEIQEHPFLFTSMLSQIVADSEGTRDIVFVEGGGNGDRSIERNVGRTSRSPAEDLKILRSQLLTNTSIVFLHADPDKTKWLRGRNPLLEENVRDHRPRVLVCEKGRCTEGLEPNGLDLDELRGALEGISMN
jgi:uncharacterized protein YyaL (SSP411 family)